METPISPQLSISLAVALMATIGLIAYAVTRLLPRTSVSTARQPHPAAISGTDNPYDSILKKAELLLSYAADNGIEVGEASWTLATNHRINSQMEAMGARRSKIWRLYQRELAG